MLEGWKTYITVAVGILFSLLAVFNIDLGMSQEQVTGAIGVLISVAIAFLRRGSKSDAASATQSIVASLSTEAKGVTAGERVGTSDVTEAVAKPIPVGKK